MAKAHIEITAHVLKWKAPVWQTGCFYAYLINTDSSLRICTNTQHSHGLELHLLEAWINGCLLSLTVACSLAFLLYSLFYSHFYMGDKLEENIYWLSVY